MFTIYVHFSDPSTTVAQNSGWVGWELTPRSPSVLLSFSYSSPRSLSSSALHLRRPIEDRVAEAEAVVLTCYRNGTALARETFLASSSSSSGRMELLPSPKCLGDRFSFEVRFRLRESGSAWALLSEVELRTSDPGDDDDGQRRHGQLGFCFSSLLARVRRRC